VRDRPREYSSSFAVAPPPAVVAPVIVAPRPYVVAPVYPVYPVYPRYGYGYWRR